VHRSLTSCEISRGAEAAARASGIPPLVAALQQLRERAGDEAAGQHDEGLELEVDAHARLAARAQVAAQRQARQSERGRVADLGGRAGVDLLAVEMGDEQLRAADRRGVARAHGDAELVLASLRARGGELVRRREPPRVDRLDVLGERRQVAPRVVVAAGLREAERARDVAARPRPAGEQRAQAVGGGVHALIVIDTAGLRGSWVV
jgi:hypothetical protein